ncbi:uncharacterized protein [Euphorbia lathyris]|uniref:uncharacterized protein n=1 Tax=Euphorbia lathyris TaxID=212925 RepID=UPI0033133F60
MCSLGFRSPQFSEDFAWLPTWLQNPQLEASGNSFKEPQSNFSQIETLSREEGRYNSCHLFLSGDDTSQTTLPPSPGNVLHLRLRLSSDGESPDSLIKSIDASIDLHCSSKVPSVQQVETSPDLQERVRLSKAASNHHEVVRFSPLSAPTVVENICPQYLANNVEIERQCGSIDGTVLIDSGLQALEYANPSSPTDCKGNRVHEEKFNVRNMKDYDVGEAVELSIAASEALVIHELMRTEATPDIVPTDIVLEAALQVKQARLEALRDSIVFSSHEIDDIDFLLDLDDLNMANAFRDVGLCFEDLDDQHNFLDVSQVKDTPMSENLNVHNDEPEDVQLMAQQDNDSALGLNNCELVDPNLDHPTEKTSDVLAAVQPQVDARSSPACLSENTEGENGECSLVNKFRSRWLGGWEVKGAVVPAKVKQKSAKGIPRFHCETSSLSESGGVAGDEYSFVQNHEIGSKIPSQSSKPFEGALDKADEGNFNSQEVRSSNQSVVDPLCSVVPCSISMENAAFSSVQKQDGGETDAQNNFNTKLGLGIESCLNVLDLNNESEPVDREALSKMNGESSEATVRRKQASLKTYSTLLPKGDVIINGQRIFQHQHLSSEYGGELLLSNQNGHCHSDSCKKNSNLTLRFEHEYSGGGGHGPNQEAAAFVVPADHDEPAEDGAEVQFKPSMQRKSPRILNRKARCRLHPSELLVENLDGKKSPELLITQGTQSKALPSKKFQNIKSTLENPHSAPTKVRKRVHFTEVEMEHQQNKDIQKPHTSQRNCSARRAKKKSKYSMLGLGSWTKDMKNCFTNQINEKKTFVFHGQEFLLTGFSSRKEREIIRLINEYGGMVLSDIPSLSSFRSRRSARSNFHQLPIIISSKKLQTTKFLYGCAVNALILKVKWLADSVAEGSRLHPEKYMILRNRAGTPYAEFGKSYHYENSRRILDSVGIMLHGKPSFCTKLALIIKHGGGQVFRTLQRLFQSLDGDKISVGAIIAEDDNKVSRHLKHCASERELVILPASWIAKSLHLGTLLSLKEKEDIPVPRAPHSAMTLDWSQEI